MILVTPTSDQHNHRAVSVWEYDESRPRNLGAEDPRQRYAVKAYLGTFPNLEEAKLATGHYSDSGSHPKDENRAAG